MSDIERRLRDLGERVREEQGSNYPSPSMKGRIKARRFSTVVVASAAALSVVAAGTFAAGWGGNSSVPPAGPNGPYSAEVPAEVVVMGEEDWVDGPHLNLAWGRDSETAATLACAGTLPPETSRVELVHDETGDVLSWGDNFVGDDEFVVVCAHDLEAELLVAIANDPSKYRLVIDRTLEVQLLRTASFSSSERSETADCGPPVDFEPTYLPDGWSRDLQRGTGAGGQGYPGLIGHFGGVRDAGVGYYDLVIGAPYAQSNKSDIRVLGRRATLGDIHEGFSVEFDHDGCTYGLIAHVFDRAELERFAEGLRFKEGGEDPPSRQAFGAVWPVDTHDLALEACDSTERFLMDPTSAALEFGYQVLDWNGGASIVEGSSEGERARVKLFRSESDPEETYVLVDLREFRQGCWLVTGVQRSPEEEARYEEQDGAMMSVQDRDVAMYFADFEDAVTATLEVGYGGESTRHLWSKGDEIAEFRLESNDPDWPNEKGHYLILLRDENGDVFSAFGSPLPAGSFAAG